MDWKEIRKGLLGKRVEWRCWKFVECDMYIQNCSETKSPIFGVELLECKGSNEYNKNPRTIRLTKEWAETLLREGRLELVDLYGNDNTVTIVEQ